MIFCGCLHFSTTKSTDILVFFLRAAEDVELWFSEVENLLAVEDLGKVCYRLSLESTHVQAVF